MSPEANRDTKLAKDRGRIAPIKLAHIVRRTSRFDDMMHWYQTVLAAEVVHSDGMLAFLTYDDEHHRIAIARIPGLEDQPQMAAGTDHVAFTHADLGDLLCTYARLKGEGIEPYWCINHGPTTSMYYKDPDGNRIELQVDNFPTAAETNRWSTFHFRIRGHLPESLHQPDRAVEGLMLGMDGDHEIVLFLRHCQPHRRPHQMHQNRGSPHVFGDGKVSDFHDPAAGTAGSRKCLGIKLIHRQADGSVEKQGEGAHDFALPPRGHDGRALDSVVRKQDAHSERVRLHITLAHVDVVDES